MILHGTNIPFGRHHARNIHLARLAWSLGYRAARCQFKLPDLAAEQGFDPAVPHSAAIACREVGLKLHVPWSWKTPHTGTWRGYDGGDGWQTITRPKGEERLDRLEVVIKRLCQTLDTTYPGGVSYSLENEISTGAHAPEIWRDGTYHRSETPGRIDDQGWEIITRLWNGVAASLGEPPRVRFPAIEFNHPAQFGIFDHIAQQISARGLAIKGGVLNVYPWPEREMPWHEALDLLEARTVTALGYAKAALPGWDFDIGEHGINARMCPNPRHRRNFRLGARRMYERLSRDGWPITGVYQFSLVRWPQFASSANQGEWFEAC